MTLRRSAVAFWVVVATTLALDQLSKHMVRLNLTEGSSLPLIDGVFHLTHVQNMGAAFGLFPGRQPVFVTTTVVVLIAIAAYWRRSRPTAWPIVVALGLITGGSLGNAIDRLSRGSVTDFFDAALIDFPVFNIADSGIVVGVIILIGWLLLVPETIDTPPIETRLDDASGDDILVESASIASAGESCR